MIVITRVLKKIVKKNKHSTINQKNIFRNDYNIYIYNIKEIELN